MDENTLDIPVGERFKYRGHVFEVRESISCQGCAFWVDEHHVCAALSYITFPRCGWLFRKDGISVIFVCVGAEGEEKK